MVTGGINVMTNVSSATGTGDASFAAKNNVKSSSKMDFQSMFTNTADNSKALGVSQPATAKTDDTPRYDADKSNARMERMMNDSDSVSEVDSEIDEMYEEIRSVIKDKLGISDEELDDILSELSMTMSDLLNPRNIMQLMLENSQTEDPVQFITNADMSETMKDINTEISTIVSDTAEKLQVSPQEVKDFAKALDDVRLDEVDGEQSFTPEKDVAVKAWKESDNVETGSENEEPGRQDKAPRAAETKNNDAQGMESVMTKLNDTVKEVFETSEQVSGLNVDTEDVIRQINQAIKVNMTQDSTSMELTLNPEHLGKVNIQVVSKNGVITANIATQDEAVRRVVETQLITLRETLNEQGIKVEAVEVTVASFTYDGRENEENNGQGSERRGRRNVISEDDTAFDDSVDATQEEMTDSTINYRA